MTIIQFQEIQGFIKLFFLGDINLFELFFLSIEVYITYTFTSLAAGINSNLLGLISIMLSSLKRYCHPKEN